MSFAFILDSMERTCLFAFLVGVLSLAEARLINVTFTNNRGEFVLQSPGWPNNAPALTNLIWELTSIVPGTRISLTCPDVRILKRVGCSEGSLTIWNGHSQLNLCTVAQIQQESVRNKMYVQFRSSRLALGRFRCVATVRPLSSLSFSEDSSEYGQGGGLRETSCPCGWTNRGRIVGGKETGVNEYIFPVNIKFPGDVQGFCGGSIISRRHILTAAHCLYGMTNRRFQVVVGEHDFRTGAETNATDIIDVQQIIMHENYDNDEMTNDIALLVLSRDIRFSQLVGPVCLPNEKYDLVGKAVKVLGWGKTSTNGNFSSTLQQVSLEVIPLNRCAERYTNFIDLQNTRQVCTFAQNRDSCQGDSGGPVIYLDPEINRWVLVAIVSFGKECASEDPAVNAEVYPYTDWIQNHVARLRPRQDTCEKI